MREANTFDILLLILLAVIWGSSFFNIKIATYSYGPLTIAFLRIFLGAILIVIICFFKNIVKNSQIIVMTTEFGSIVTKK